MQTRAERKVIGCAGLLLMLAAQLLFVQPATAEPRVKRLPRQWAEGRGHPRSSRPDRHAHDLVSRRCRRRSVGKLWGCAFPRAPDVQVDGQRSSPGEFSRTITQLGGRDNAVTTHDTTSYYPARRQGAFACGHALEADRMAHLRFVEEEVADRAGRHTVGAAVYVEANPFSVLSEQMLAVLYQNHPYGRPSIGWEHEMAKLSRQDAILSTGAIMPPTTPCWWWPAMSRRQRCRPLAQATYGRNKPNPAAGPPAAAAGAASRSLRGG